MARAYGSRLRSGAVPAAGPRTVSGCQCRPISQVYALPAANGPVSTVYTPLAGQTKLVSGHRPQRSSTRASAVDATHGPLPSQTRIIGSPTQLPLPQPQPRATVAPGVQATAVWPAANSQPHSRPGPPAPAAGHGWTTWAGSTGIGGASSVMVTGSEIVLFE